jgi:hypothetical protein
MARLGVPALYLSETISALEIWQQHIAGLIAARVGLAPAALVLLIRYWVPESPHWLLRRGRTEQPARRSPGRSRSIRNGPRCPPEFPMKRRSMRH